MHATWGALRLSLVKIFKTFYSIVTFKSHEKRDENNCRRSLRNPSNKQ